MAIDNDELVTEEVVKNTKAKKRRVLSFGISILAVLTVIITTLYFAIFVYYPVTIIGDSMNPTLTNEDVVLANGKAKPRVGDVVVIKDENETSLIIKRVIAVEGQTVEIKDGSVYVDGIVLNEPYTNSSTIDYHDNWTNRTIAKGEIFYLGDNRINSKDSRDLSYDTCKVEQVVGVVPKWAIFIKGVTTLLL